MDGVVARASLEPSNLVPSVTAWKAAYAAETVSSS